MSQFLSILRGFSSQLIRARMFLAVVGGVLLLSGMAHASLIPSLVNGPVNIGNGQFRYDYRISLSADERIDPAATNGVTCPGPSNSNVQCNPAGTFVTFYDIPSFITASAPNPGTGGLPAGGFFSTVVQFTGQTPNSINGAAFDSPSLPNVVYIYTGPVINGPAVFTGFSIITTQSGLNPFGNFTSQSTNNTTSSTSGTSDQVIGSVPIPVGTTAATASVSGRIVTSFGKGIRGVQVTLTGTNSPESRTVLSGQFGYYNFPDVQVGQTYIITASGKHYGFTQSTVLRTILDDTPDVNFYAFDAGKIR